MNEFRSNFSETRGKHRIAFVQSCWHRDIVDEMRDAFTETFQGSIQEALITSRCLARSRSRSKLKSWR